MTTKWIECITSIGLFLMPTEVRRERMNRVFVNGDEISGPALAELIDECKNIAGAMMEQHKDSKSVSEEKKNTIREMLELTDGAAEVVAIGLTEEIDWLIELRDKVYSEGITVADLTQN